MGTKRHLVVNGQGTPLGLTLSGANRHDSRMLVAIDAIPLVRDHGAGRADDTQAACRQGL
jgi:hypothetical protein